MASRRPSETPFIAAVGAADSSGTMGLAAASLTAVDFGMTAACVTACVVARARNGEVRAVHAVPPRIVARQMDAAAALKPGAGVIGMLARHQTLTAVAERIRRREMRRWVLDPVTGVSAGRQLMTARGVKLLSRVLVPLCEVVCIDARGADAWPGIEIGGMPGAARAAEKLLGDGADWVLVRGTGSSEGNRCLLFGTEQLDMDWEGKTAADGDRLSAAIACGLADGLRAPEAVIRAHEYLGSLTARKPAGNGAAGVRSEAGDD